MTSTFYFSIHSNSNNNHNTSASAGFHVPSCQAPTGKAHTSIAIMSLRIKKGTKVWGPKAPVARRPGAPPSAPSSSARPSVERQSQTPVPAPVPAEPLPVLAEEQEVAEQQPVTEPPTASPIPDVVVPDKPPVPTIIPEAEPTNTLERNESTNRKEPSSLPPKRAVPDEPHTAAIIPEAEPTNTLKRKESTNGEESSSLLPKRVRIEEHHVAAIIPEAEPTNTLKRKESTNGEEPSSLPPKRVRVEEPPHRSPTPPQSPIRPVKPSPPTTEESNAARPSSPVAETRQDIESSVYPDPELSSGLGPAGAITSGITGIPEAAGLGPAGDGYSSAAQIALAPQIVQTTVSEFEASQSEGPAEAVAGPAKKKKAVRRRKVQPTDEDNENGTATLEMNLNAPRRITSRRGRKKKETNGTKRGVTPEGAEDEQINPSTMKMAELCQDIRIGVKSSNHDMIKQRIIDQRAKAKLAKSNPDTPPIEAAQPGGQNSALDDPEAGAIPSGPQMRIVNGQIVLAENSLHLDRQKRAEAENEDMVEVDENEFSHIITSGTYMKRERSQVWDSIATATFYQGLAQFGTNFEMIAKLLPSRSRRQIKLKFNSEERKNPARLNKILMGKPQAIDLENFEEMSGLKLEEVSEIEKERKEIEDEHERELQARDKERADADLRKKKEIADKSGGAKKPLSGDGEDGSSGKENRVARNASMGVGEIEAGSKKAKSRKKKNPHGRGDGGEVIEVLGSV